MPAYGDFANYECPFCGGRMMFHHDPHSADCFDACKGFIRNVAAETEEGRMMLRFDGIEEKLDALVTVLKKVYRVLERIQKSTERSL